MKRLFVFIAVGYLSATALMASEKAVPDTGVSSAQRDSRKNDSAILLDIQASAQQGIHDLQLTEVKQVVNEGKTLLQAIPFFRRGGYILQYGGLLMAGIGGLIPKVLLASPGEASSEKTTQGRRWLPLPQVLVALGLASSVGGKFMLRRARQMQKKVEAIEVALKNPTAIGNDSSLQEARLKDEDITSKE